VFSAGSIQPGTHKLKVIRYFKNPYSYYPVQKVVYKGWITIPPKSIVYAQINCRNQFDVVKIMPYFTPPSNGWGCGNGWDDDDCEDEWLRIRNKLRIRRQWMGKSCASYAPMCMPDMQFMQLKNSIESKSFESSKLQMAKQALNANYFSSAQAADLMSVFSFESTRLDFAKYAYAKVIDKQNYYLVNNAFSFESSIQDLNQYIAGN